MLLAEKSNVFEQLGLTWQEVIFHAISLCLLAVVLWYLLYKPVKKMIQERKTKIQEVFEKNQKLQQEANSSKREYEQLLMQAREEATIVAQEATAKAQESVKSILEEAEKKAEAIVGVAHKETVVEFTRMQNEFKEKAADIIIDIASKIVEREVNEKDNKKFIEECLKEWDK
ncbi:MAG: ATP synthase F0 subunit B [Clostridiales bacterium]|jgi:F-type H+-transporting ATPase subunit b|nr:ATP synthase F0 subunit B [Clostridiales bacterium]